MTWHVRRLVCCLEFGPGDLYHTKLCALRPCAHIFYFLFHPLSLFFSFYPPIFQRAKTSEEAHHQLMNPSPMRGIHRCSIIAFLFFFWNRNARWCGGKGWMKDALSFIILFDQLPNGSMMGQWAVVNARQEQQQEQVKLSKNGGYLPFLLFYSSYYLPCCMLDAFNLTRSIISSQKKDAKRSSSIPSHPSPFFFLQPLVALVFLYLNIININLRDYTSFLVCFWSERFLFSCCIVWWAVWRFLCRSFCVWLPEEGTWEGPCPWTKKVFFFLYGCYFTLSMLKSKIQRAKGKGSWTQEESVGVEKKKIGKTTNKTNNKNDDEMAFSCKLFNIMLDSFSLFLLLRVASLSRDGLHCYPMDHQYPLHQPTLSSK